MQLKKGGFTFKRFFIAHDKSPMKITTDSCLLGAWAPIHPTPDKVLDIGCGCGIIALMLAQRLENTNSQIDAIDIDHNAIEQSMENIKQSPFYRIDAQCIDINEFKVDEQSCYDLIVTNPPYFESAVDCRNAQRQQARYTENLNHQQLIEVVKRLLKPAGQFCLVLPYQLSAPFQSLCELNQLYLTQELNVRYTADKPFSLTLLSFGLQTTNAVVTPQALCMRDIDGCYSGDFRQLLNEFYLFRR